MKNCQQALSFANQVVAFILITMIYGVYALYNVSYHRLIGDSNLGWAQKDRDWVIFTAQPTMVKKNRSNRKALIIQGFLPK